MVKLETSSGEHLLLFLPLGLLRCLLSPLRHVALLVSSGDVASAVANRHALQSDYTTPLKKTALCRRHRVSRALARRKIVRRACIATSATSASTFAKSSPRCILINTRNPHGIGSSGNFAALLDASAFLRACALSRLVEVNSNAQRASEFVRGKFCTACHFLVICDCATDRN